MTSAKTFADKKEICWRQKFAYRICWQKEDLQTTKIWWRNLLTKTKSADKNEICWQKTSSYKICLRKERHLAMEKILKYLFKGHMINATMDMSFKSLTEALDVNIYARWKLCSHLFKNVIQQLVASVGTWGIPLTNIKTADYGNMLTESADKMWICLLEKSVDRICWQKTNLLTESADKNRICWRPKNRADSTHQTSSKNFASRQPGHGWRAHSFGQI